MPGGHELPGTAAESGSDLGALEPPGIGELDPVAAERIETLATDLAQTLATADPGTRAYRRALARVDTLGEREIQATTEIAGRFQDRPVRALEEALSERMPLAENHRRLRRIAERLARMAGEAARSRTDVRAELAGADEQLRPLVAALDAEREVLDVDNGLLGQQERALWTEIHALREYSALAARVDVLLDARIEAVAQADAATARDLRADVQLTVRRRRRDLLMQLAVASQGYAALRSIEQGNLELIWLIRSMSTTTISALRTAALAAEAMSNGRLTAASHASDLRAAWQDVLHALDQVEVRRRQTLDEVHQTK